MIARSHAPRLPLGRLSARPVGRAADDHAKLLINSSLGEKYLWPTTNIRSSLEREDGAEYDLAIEPGGATPLSGVYRDAGLRKPSEALLMAPPLLEGGGSMHVATAFPECRKGLIH